MSGFLLIAGLLMIACIILNKVSSKIGMPMLLSFILLGMLVGSDGLFKIPFDNFILAEKICSAALIFIMFYGGFGTKWNEAKPVAVKAICLSSLGTVMTAGLVGLFCHFVLKISLLESFLIGAVISSTDAASVFSILRSKRLNLRFNTASLLEIESGSNDPFSYMLTIILLSLASNSMSTGSFYYMLFAQIVFGILFGFGIGFLTMLFLKRFTISSSGFYAIFMVSVAIISFSLPTLFHGNGYLSTYITGIFLGNQRINNKLELVHFFDGITGLMQMLLFFLLGLLSFPSQLPEVALISLCIALFLTFIARPITVFAILSPFRSDLRQKLLVSWSGLRGAASIVFSTMVVTHPAIHNNDIFHIVFFIVLFSLLLQGTFLPHLAKKLDMTDQDSDVMKTFNDYIDELPVQFIQFTIPPSHEWIGKEIRELTLPPNSLLILLIRGAERIVPNGKTTLQCNDTLILSGMSSYKMNQMQLYEKKLEHGSDLIEKTISNLSQMEELVILIRRGEEIIIPNGDTVLLEHDILVLSSEKLLLD